MDKILNEKRVKLKNMKEALDNILINSTIENNQEEIEKLFGLLADYKGS